MKNTLLFLLIIFFFWACDENQPVVQYKNDSVSISRIVNDTSKIFIAELPVHFDSTDFLIHSIGTISKNGRSENKIIKNYSYDSDYETGFAIGYHLQDDFSGDISNLIFENIKTRQQRLLTNKVLNITNVQFLRNIWKKTNRPYLLYSVIDQDLNHDGEYDYEDIESLYISNLEGTNFKKLTEPNHRYNNGQMILDDLKYYYRTVEDVDKNGEFNKKDLYHYYYIDFSIDPYKVVEYDPLKLIKSMEP